MTASYETIQSNILEPMQALYRTPFGMEDKGKALAQYAKHLSDFDAVDLANGWTRLVDDYKAKSWPAIGEIREACKEARKANDNKPKSDAHLPVWMREDERWTAMAYRVCRSEMGRQAYGEGWFKRLFDFVETKGREPSPIEQVEQRKKSAAFKRKHEGTSDPVLLKALRAMNQLNESIARECGLGEYPPVEAKI